MGFRTEVRCICHTLTLVVIDAIDEIDLYNEVLELISNITIYVNCHANIQAKLYRLQYEEFTEDSILTLSKDCPTAWHSKLSVLEKYNILKPYLARVLPTEAPQLLDEVDEDFIAECILVL